MRNLSRKRQKINNIVLRVIFSRAPSMAKYGNHREEHKKKTCKTMQQWLKLSYREILGKFQCTVWFGGYDIAELSPYS